MASSKLRKILDWGEYKDFPQLKTIMKNIKTSKSLQLDAGSFDDFYGIICCAKNPTMFAFLVMASYK